LHRLQPEQVERIEAELPDRNAQVLTYPQPKTESQARFSMEYCLACALCFGDVVESDFLPDALQRAAVRELMPRVRLLDYPADPKGTDSSPEEPDHIRVWLKSGENFQITIGDVPGGPRSPLSEREFSAKLHQCAEPVIGKACTGELELALRDFSRLANVSAVTRHLRGPRDDSPASAGVSPR
jgi:2-methylcitrate dehydratase PrpD